MSDYTPAPDNRPERCGHMLAALRTIQINANSAAKFYADPEYHANLLTAIREIDKYAEEAILADEGYAAANQAEFQRWVSRDETRCATCHRSAHYSNDAPGAHGHPYAAPGTAPDLRGVSVNRADDDSPVPAAGVILDRAGSVGDRFVWVAWDAGEDEDPAVLREAIDGLVRAGGGRL